MEINIIQPKVELWRQGEDAKAHVARCARVCYRSEKTTGNDKLCNNLIARKHFSMFRHETVYAIIPIEDTSNIWFQVTVAYTECPYIHWVSDGNSYYVATNGQCYADLYVNNPVFAGWINTHRVSEEEFLSYEPAWRELARWTFHVTTQISTSRELNRVSPNNIAEESTRYVYEDRSICRPWWYDDNEIGTPGNICVYETACDTSFDYYDELIKRGMLREDARGVLPIDTATEVAYTYSIKEWRHIIDLRYYGITGRPHHNAKIIAGLIRRELMDLGYDFR